MFGNEIAWAGGLFEGEGYICARGHSSGSRALRVGLDTTDLDSLQRFHKAINRGNITGPYARGVNKPIYQWLSQKHSDALDVIAILWPYLGSRRQATALSKIALYAEEARHLR